MAPCSTVLKGKILTPACTTACSPMKHSSPSTTPSSIAGAPAQVAAAAHGAAPQAHARAQIGVVVDHGALYEGVGPHPDVAAEHRVLPQRGARLDPAVVPDYGRASHLGGGVDLGAVAQPDALAEREPG